MAGSHRGRYEDGYVPAYPIHPMEADPAVGVFPRHIARPYNIWANCSSAPINYRWPLAVPYSPPAYLYDYDSECERAKHMPIDIPRPLPPDHCRIHRAFGRPDIEPPMWVADPHIAAILAIYDRFGRLLYGHPSSPVDVLEYVVFENYITDEYGQWRIHGKVAPAWARGFAAVAAPRKTYRLVSFPDPTT
ncbi:39S ribosomal protein L45 [Echinococcus granulosus]|uniref:39S ribosomal protein L45 n=1 Tax=Echinococcus granulosus TaxID=6210 RepID=W6UJY0_ECHGR|nr:39S ribosomal protein L45 [Echinococcus granulosus]EUB58427.1 39S ribosomal protein L45 [Echinococcus granulosus]